MYKRTSTFCDPLSVLCVLLLLVAASLAWGAFYAADVAVSQLASSPAPLR
jgi:hypothetical protein